MPRQSNILLAALAFAFQIGIASAQEWRPLVDDTSRAALFQREIQSATPAQNVGAFALDGPFTFPGNALHDLGAPRANSIFGIDLSHHNSPDPHCNAAMDRHREIDFDALRQQEIRFVFVKATQGVGYRDCRFVEYWQALGQLAPDNRPWRGAYHFLTAGSPAADQAASYIRLIQENGGFSALDLPPTLDLEWDVASQGTDRWIGHSAQDIVTAALTWLDMVEKASGRTPMLYTARSWCRERGITNAMFAQFSHYGLWIADYSQTHRAVEAPSTPRRGGWQLWQFAADARLTEGFANGLDASIFKGSESDFRERLLPPSATP